MGANTNARSSDFRINVDLDLKLQEKCVFPLWKQELIVNAYTILQQLCKNKDDVSMKLRKVMLTKQSI